MFDLSASLFFLPVATLILLLFLYRREEARLMGKMADSLEELHLLELKNRRSKVQKDLRSLDPLPWLAAASGGQLTLEACLGQSTAPAWLNLRIKHGGRLVVSPLAPAALKKTLPDHKTSGRLGKAFEPFLGHSPRRLKISSCSLAEQEYFDLEAAEVGRQLGARWGEVTRLWFYQVPAPRQS